MITQSDEPSIRLDRVSVRLGLRVVISQATVSIESGGGITALIGPNGSGKTTFLNTVCGFVPLISGRLYVLGSRAYFPFPWRTALRGVFRLFQDTRGFTEFSIRECSALPLEHFGTQQARERLLREFGLWEDRDRSVGEMSYGQQRSVALSLGSGPKTRLMLLDEPFSGLDEPRRASVAHYLRAAADDGARVVIADHDLPTLARISDEAIVIVNRRITHLPSFDSGCRLLGWL